MMRRILLAPLALAAMLATASGCATDGTASARTDRLRHKLMDPASGVFIAAHRGCHNASPRLGLPPAPENSLPALEHCVQLGVDMMELDVRRSRDGKLVVIHDDTLDRTTQGSGKVAGFTLAELRRFHLRQNMGGAMSPTVTAETVPALVDMLEAARGRILLNLDVKEDIYDDVVAEVRARRMEKEVLIKTVVTAPVAPEADRSLFDGIPYMPIVGNGMRGPLAAPPARIAAAQLDGTHRPVGVEIVYLAPDEAAALQVVVRRAGVRLWANALTSVGVVSVIGVGGDLEALRTSGAAWGALMRLGVDTIQTDEPGPLLDYLEREGIRH